MANVYSSPSDPLFFMHHGSFTPLFSIFAAFELKYSRLILLQLTLTVSGQSGAS
jgi:hypothetical protein